MMREIKFRAWIKDLEEMVSITNLDFMKKSNGDDFANKSKGYGSDGYSRFIDIKESVIMQYTGLKDKNGIDVYEGDVLKRVVHLKMFGTDLDQKIDDIVEVQWREEYSGFFVGERPLFAEINANFDYYTSCRCTKYEVIGNIYENKELSKENEER